MSEINENLNNESNEPNEPDGEKIRCRFCNRLNKIKGHTAGASIRCGSCRLPLSDKPHKKWSLLDPHSYIHPLDSEALNALKKIPGTETILKKLLEVVHESSSRVFFSA